MIRLRCVTDLLNRYERTLLHCCLLLLIGQINALALEYSRTDAVDPQPLLETSLSIKAEVYFGDEYEVIRLCPFD
jgi:hypothetical protein